MEHVRNLFDNLPVLKEAKREVRREAKFQAKHAKFLDAATGIMLAPDAVELAYMARQLVQCTLPHRDPGNVEQWTRESGGLVLGIIPGRDLLKNKSLGCPYGSIPRLLLFWLVTEVVQKKSRRIFLGRSLSEFMRDVGLDPNTGGGKRGDAKRLREQMRRLFGARISFQQSLVAGDKRGERWLNMEVAPEGEFWWDPKQPEQGTLWESWIQLGEKFYEAVVASPVPVDMRALRALKQSPLALDLYAWATYRAYLVGRRGRSQFFPWRGLMQQMGTDYKDVKDFKKYASLALRKVQTVYPALKIKKVPGGFEVLPCPTAVPGLTS